jgi:hypothetical protein
MKIDDEHRRCSVCLSVLPLDRFYLSADRSRKSNKNFSSKCKDCYCAARRLSWEAKKGTPFDVPLAAYLNHIFLKAGYRRKVSFTRDDLYDLWVKQKGLCALTGWEMTTRRNTGLSKTNISIDRIDSGRGYELENVQLVCAAANKAKWDLPEDEFLALCKAVINKRGVSHGRREPSSGHTEAERSETETLSGSSDKE